MAGCGRSLRKEEVRRGSEGNFLQGSGERERERERGLVLWAQAPARVQIHLSIVGKDGVEERQQEVGVSSGLSLWRLRVRVAQQLGIHDAERIRLSRKTADGKHWTEVDYEAGSMNVQSLKRITCNLAQESVRTQGICTSSTLQAWSDSHWRGCSMLCPELSGLCRRAAARIAIACGG